MSNHRDLHDRTACIIDGDNIARGGELPLGSVTRVLARVSALSRGCSVTFAMQRRLAANYMTAYSGLGWGIRFASMAPDAADRELLEAAADYVTHDVKRLLVVSGDHAFAELAGVVPLHVCSYRDSLSRRLRLAATSVTYLDDLLPVAA
jgi:hypothetical protein